MAGPPAAVARKLCSMVEGVSHILESGINVTPFYFFTILIFKEKRNGFKCFIFVQLNLFNANNKEVKGSRIHVPCSRVSPAASAFLKCFG